ncbi:MULTISPECIES: hypothetical protein [Niastella]|uniref:HMA domain-containing protein n=1 Tax=Niastella soli TaxID=2821487 RepID=A0ABS3Z3F0_9BACT|nr:hypothetical protein [Niastella soli]MBO9204665.1 hypothetical protein [Niastella soli]
MIQNKTLMVLFTLVVLLSCKSQIKGNVELKCIYMGYACGDCGAKYKIQEIKKHEYALPEDIKGADLEAVFTFPSQEKIIDKMVKNCAICYDYYFWGNLSKHSGKDFYTVNIDSFTVTLRDSCCDK